MYIQNLFLVTGVPNTALLTPSDWYLNVRHLLFAYVGQVTFEYHQYLTDNLHWKRAEYSHSHKRQEFVWKKKGKTLLCPQEERLYISFDNMFLNVGVWIWIFMVLLYFHSLWTMTGILGKEGCYAAEDLNCFINFGVINLYYVFREVIENEKSLRLSAHSVSARHSTRFSQHWLNLLSLFHYFIQVLFYFIFCNHQANLEMTQLLC